MINLRSSARVTVALTAVLALFCPSFADEELDPAWLVLQLPTNNAVRRNRDVEQKLVDLGPRALLALERELHLGITSKQREKLGKANGSRRGAVVRVLARIPGEASTDLLVRSLSDPPDNYGMTVGILDALKMRTLSAEQIITLLGQQKPEIVLTGMNHPDAKTSFPEIKTEIERLFDPDAAKVQLQNKHRVAWAQAAVLWEVRLTAGKLLERDMLPEIRARAAVVLAELQEAASLPPEPNQAEWIKSGSTAELTIFRCLNQLHDLGQPVKDLVVDAAQTAEGIHANVLDMALARLGDPQRIAKVADLLTISDVPRVRVCAAVTLRIVGDKSTIPALRKALRDPYQRADSSCMPIGDGMVHPVRRIVADALADLGENPRHERIEIKIEEIKK